MAILRILTFYYNNLNKFPIISYLMILFRRKILNKIPIKIKFRSSNLKLSNTKLL